jgi:hypothetical protein
VLAATGVAAPGRVSYRSKSRRAGREAAQVRAIKVPGLGADCEGDRDRPTGGSGLVLHIVDNHTDDRGDDRAGRAAADQLSGYGTDIEASCATRSEAELTLQRLDKLHCDTQLLIRQFLDVIEQALLEFGAATAHAASWPVPLKEIDDRRAKRHRHSFERLKARKGVPAFDVGNRFDGFAHAVGGL